MKAAPDLSIDSHPSVGDQEIRHESIASLEANRLEPKFLYVTPRQSELWRQVFLRHSPIQGNPDFTRIYQEAFAQIQRRLPTGEILLVGLGCGTGSKELDLYKSLKASGHEALFCAIDVSRELVEESASKLIEAGSEHRRSLVCDLTQTAFLKEWLKGLDESLPRLITFFGLVPNFAPSVVSRIFRAILRPGDVLLVSAHLAPVADEKGDDLPDAMKVVLPQYDNPETRAWLSAALENWGLDHRIEAPQINIGEVESIPAFIGSAAWKTQEPFEKWGHRFSPRQDEPLRLFYSLRYTPALFESVLRREGFTAERLAMTSCREEALWCVCEV